MEWFDDLRQTWREMAASPPGKRFALFQQRRKVRREGSLARSVLGLSLGILLVVAGIVLWLLPVLPGFFLSIIGLAIIATRLPWLGRLLDRGEVALRAWIGSLRRRV